MYTDNTKELEVFKNLNSLIKRYDIINYLVKKNNFHNYLEIGVFNGENIKKIDIEHKDGVDPGYEGIFASEVNYRLTSDQFFELIKNNPDIKYDLIFIDGLHHSDQVEKDIKNSLNHIVSNGYIILHDCNPCSYESQLVPRQTIAWNGDVWKAFINFKQNNPSYDCCVVDTDFGIGVIKVNGIGYNLDTRLDAWDVFKSNRKELLNLIDFETFKKHH